MSHPTVKTTSVMQRDEIFALMKEYIVQIIPELKGKNIEYTNNLKELGADSMERVDILVMMMESLALNTPKIDFADVGSLGELVDRLAMKLEQAHEH